MQIKISATEMIDTEKFNADQLQLLHDDIARRADEVNVKLGAAKFANKQGKPPDPDWWSKAILAKKRLSAARELLVREISHRRKRDRFEKNALWRISSNFVKVAKEYLPEATFNTLMAEAVRRHESTKPEEVLGEDGDEL